MSVQWDEEIEKRLVQASVPNWKARGFASYAEYEQWLDDEAQSRYLAERRTQHPNGGCGKAALFAMLPALVIWAGIVALWMQPWRP